MEKWRTYVGIVAFLTTLLSTQGVRSTVAPFLEEVDTVVRPDGQDLAAVIEVRFRSTTYEAMTLTAAATATHGWEAVIPDNLLKTAERPNALPTIRVELRPTTVAAKDGDFVVIKLGFISQERPTQGHATKIYLQLSAGRLELRRAEDYYRWMEAEPGDPSGIRFTGTVTPYGDEVRTPFDLPGITEAEAAYLVEQMDAARTDEVQQTGGALSVSAVADSSSVDGCANTRTATPIFILAGLLFVISRRLRRHVAGAAILLSLAAHGNSASAAICGYGTLVFWDGRSNGQGAHDTTDDGIPGPWLEAPYVDYGGAARPGWRLRECNSTSPATCAPSSSTCCFSALPQVELTLWKSVSGGPYSQVGSTYGALPSGYFSVCDNTLTAGATYKLRVHYRSNSSAPTLFEVEPSVGGAAFYTDVPLTGMAIPHGSVGQISVNPALDTTSLGADVSNMYAVMWHTFAAIEAEGETRHRKKFTSPPNARDLIENQYDATIGGHNVSDSIFQIGAAFAHGWLSAHEIGHILTHRAISRVYFANNPQNIDPVKNFSSEGIAMNEAFSDAIAFLYQFDPQAVSISEVMTSLPWPCSNAGVGHQSVNKASMYGNNVLGLWELLDIDQSNAHHSKSDLTDVTLKQIVDAMKAMDADTSGASGSINEATYTVPGPICTAAHVCTAWGQVCPEPGGSCIGGDVHGENIRDWVRNLPFGKTTMATTYADTLISNQCLGAVDNFGTSGGNGGFRDD